jgi:hypothetical protein
MSTLALANTEEESSRMRAQLEMGQRDVSKKQDEVTKAESKAARLEEAYAAIEATIKVMRELRVV